VQGGQVAISRIATKDARLHGFDRAPAPASGLLCIEAGFTVPATARTDGEEKTTVGGASRHLPTLFDEEEDETTPEAHSRIHSMPIGLLRTMSPRGSVRPPSLRPPHRPPSLVVPAELEAEERNERQVTRSGVRRHASTRPRRAARISTRLRGWAWLAGPPIVVLAVAAIVAAFVR
jgi:hypothetical protein